MSMLADRRPKQKWSILQGDVNKNNNWSKDSNKLGQKMLERMGWKEGKGLGRMEDGRTENIKVRCKNNSKGMGFKDSVEWSVQQDNFNVLLDELSGSKDDVKHNPQEVKSLVEKSQNSRARVHYRKFTRGKDLSRYSEKDLANILGKKKLTEPEVQEETQNLTTSGVSMVDYFKNKMSASLGKSSSGSSKNSSDLEDDCVSYGFGFNPKTSGDADENDVKKNKKDKNKSKSSKESFVSYVSDNVDDSKETPKKRKGDLLEALDEVVDTPSKKKLKFEASPSGEISKKSKKSKKKSKNEEDLSNLGVSNPAFEPLGKNVTIKKEVLETITENDAENDLNESQIIVNEENSKKKKCKVELDQEIVSVETQTKTKGKKKKQKENSELNSFAIDNPSLNISDFDPNEALGEQEAKPKKKKKSKGLDNPALNDSQLSLPESELQDVPDHSENYEVKRKKKKSKGLVSSNDSTESQLAPDHSGSENYEIKSKNKKKSKGLVNPALNLNDSAESQIAPDHSGLENYEVKRKSKKKSKGLVNCNDSAESQPAPDHSECDKPTENYEVKCKSKKSKGLVNPALNLNDSAESQVAPDHSGLENYEVKRKSKKKSKDNVVPPNESSSSLAESQNKNVSMQNGIDNTALEISDCDIMLNVTNEPVKNSVTPKIGAKLKNKSKNVRFSKTNQEHIISDRSPGDIIKRNELYDINTKVIQDGIHDFKKPSPTNHFDIKSVDKIDFCDDGSSQSPRKRLRTGIDNQGFDAKAQNVEESVNSLAKTLDQYQAEVENGINESKVNKAVQEFMIGELRSPEGNGEHKDGVVLQFKYASFNKREQPWVKKNDSVVAWPKKSYKHLIRGDVILGFKNCNLHKINGYGARKPKDS